jgi:hypothetical protein
LIKGMRIHGSMRFLSADTAAQKVQGLLQKSEFGAIPPDVDLGDSFKQDELTGVLNTLQDSWSLIPAQRTHARIKVVARLNVVNGLKEIRRKISPVQQGGQASNTKNKDILHQERVDLRMYGFVTEKTKKMMADATEIEEVAKQEKNAEEEHANTESWLMKDVSECGYGVVIPSMKEDWICIGALLALKPENEERWHVGIMRRLHRDKNMKIYVGISVLSHEPVSVLLRALGEDVSVWEKVANVAASESVNAILLPKGTICIEESSLLMEPGNFVMDKSFEMIIRGERRLVKLKQLLDEGQGYQRIGFVELELPLSELG